MAQRFVILEHTGHGPDHFDLMLEHPDAERLKTWQLDVWPLQSGESCPCRELAPHRREYLTYEGEVSGNRGRVRRVTSGIWKQSPKGIELTPEGGKTTTLSIQEGKATAL
jgi:hypothetical protein